MHFLKNYTGPQSRDSSKCICLQNYFNKTDGISDRDAETAKTQDIFR